MNQNVFWTYSVSILLASMIATVGYSESLSVSPAERTATEKDCKDGKDNDGDTVYDCADADCSKDPACQPDGLPENTNQRCHDWVDNDEDGAIDCEDEQCQSELITACLGSWDLQIKGNSKKSKVTPVSSSSQDTVDLMNTQGDNDGERNDYLCSDGIDNDNDGKIDCEDLGCKFDESVQVCRGAPKMRFSVVGQIKHTYDYEAESRGEPANGTRFSRLQLRSFGPIPQIQNSFYLISLLTERTPRLTFAMFSVPIGKTRHQFIVNSGAAGLSQAQALSIHKQLLVDRTRIFRAFEAFNAAGLEVTGPLTDRNKINYRFFAAGGSGRYDGNIGGRSVNEEDINYPWSSGIQFGLNLAGYYSRFDTPFLYTPVPLTIAILSGVKYDRREREHFISTNVHAALRFRRFVTMVEHYYKKEYAFDSQQASYHAQVGFLLWPKHIMLAADYGRYEAEPFKSPPERYSNLVREPKDEQQYRMAAHWYFYRQVGVFSLVYNYRTVEEGMRDINEDDNYRDLIERKLELIAQFRF